MSSLYHMWTNCRCPEVVTVPPSWARTALHKAPVGKGEQGEEQLARAIDYTKESQATEIQESEVCSTAWGQAEMGHVVFYIDVTHNVQFPTSIPFLLRKITTGC